MKRYEIGRRVFQANSRGVKFYDARSIPHRLSRQQKADRMTLLEDMPQMMNDLARKQENYLRISDESRISWDNSHRGMWAQDIEHAPSKVKKIISSTNTILSSYFSRTGFVSITFLPQGKMQFTVLH
jgi:hypothetical protein